MRIHHIIIGVKNLAESEKFYCECLGFRAREDVTDSKTGAIGKILQINNENQKPLEVLLIPFDESRHPNPQHIAFEVSTQVFDSLYPKIKKLNIYTRANPSLFDVTDGVGKLTCGLYEYRNFYILDPNGINIEIMCLLEK